MLNSYCLPGTVIKMWLVKMYKSKVWCVIEDCWRLQITRKWIILISCLCRNRYQHHQFLSLWKKIDNFCHLNWMNHMRARNYIRFIRLIEYPIRLFIPNKVSYWLKLIIKEKMQVILVVDGTKMNSKDKISVILLFKVATLIPQSDLLLKCMQFMSYSIFFVVITIITNSLRTYFSFCPPLHIITGYIVCFYYSRWTSKINSYDI